MAELGQDQAVQISLMLSRMTQLGHLTWNVLQPDEIPYLGQSANARIEGCYATQFNGKTLMLARILEPSGAMARVFDVLGSIPAMRISIVLAVCEANSTILELVPDNSAMRSLYHSVIRSRMQSISTFFGLEGNASPDLTTLQPELANEPPHSAVVQEPDKQDRRS